MQYVVVAVAGIAIVALLFISIWYYRAKQKGKGYVAVAIITGMGTTFAVYISWLAVPWQVVVVALFSADPQLAIALQPSPTAIVASTTGLLGVELFLYLLANKAMRKSRLPINASAEELEDLTGTASVLALALAHLRFRLAGKADNPIRLPGENPYRLPDPQKEPDWTALAADLLVQLEPNLLRETFRYVQERQLFILSGTDALDQTRELSWLVRAIPSQDQITAAIGLLEEAASASKLNGRTTLAICVDVVDRIDEVVHTPGQRKVRILSKTALVDKCLDLSYYVNSLVRRFEQRVVPGADYALRDCFVPPKVRRVRSGGAGLIGETELNDGNQHDLLDYLRVWVDRPGLDHVSIIGEFGQGKSTALLAYCCDWANRWRTGDRSGRVPLLIELRGKSPRRQAPDQFLVEWGDRYGLRGGALLNLIQSGRAIIIFEGFDEVQDAGLRYDRFEQFKALWGFSYPGTKIVFTGRPNFFLDTLERETLLRANQAARDAGLANSEVFALAFLERPEIAKALSRYPLNTVQEILAQCDSDPAFMEIAKRPSMLPVIGNQWSNIKAELREKGGITSAAIIEHFIDFLYARKEADQDKLGEYQILSRELRNYFTARIAWKMMTERQKNTIDRHQFLQAVGDAYRSLDAEFRMDEEGRADVAGAVRQLKESFRETSETDIVSTLATDMRTNGIFAPDPAGGRDNLYFPHKQYFEFILGRVFVDWLRCHNKHSWLRAMGPSEVLQCFRSEPVSAFFAAGLLTPAELDDPPHSSFLDSTRAPLMAIFSVTLSGLVLTPWRFQARRRNSSLYKVLQACPPYYRYLIYFKKENIADERAVVRAFSVANRTVIVTGFTIITTTVVNLIVLRAQPEWIRAFLGSVSSHTLLTWITTSFFASASFALLLAVLGMGITVSIMPNVGFPSSLREFYLLSHLYRRNAVKGVLDRNGTKAHAALVFLIAWALPRGAVELPAAMLLDASTTLELTPDAALPLTKRADLL